MRGLYCTREEWGAVIVNYFQGSDLQRKGRSRKTVVWRGMVRVAAVRRCRGGGGNSYSPLGEILIYTVALAGRGALAQK